MYEGVKTGASYFGELVREAERNRRIRDLVDIESCRKIVVCDVGSTKRDLFALWVIQFNRYSGRFEFIDYEQFPSANEETIVTWINKNEYNVKQFVGPWDFGIGMTPPIVNFQKLMPMCEMVALPKNANKLDRIREGRRQFNRCDFDMRRTIVGINCLKRYSKVWDKKNEVYLASPLHNEYSHGADAYTHFAVALALDKLDLRSDEAYDMDRSKANFADTYDPNSRWNSRGAVLEVDYGRVECKIKVFFKFHRRNFFSINSNWKYSICLNCKEKEYWSNRETGKWIKRVLIKEKWGVK